MRVPRKLPPGHNPNFPRLDAVDVFHFVCDCQVGAGSSWRWKKKNNNKVNKLNACDRIPIASFFVLMRNVVLCCSLSPSPSLFFLLSFSPSMYLSHCGHDSCRVDGRCPAAKARPRAREEESGYGAASHESARPRREEEITRMGGGGGLGRKCRNGRNRGGGG